MSIIIRSRRVDDVPLGLELAQEGARLACTFASEWPDKKGSLHGCYYSTGSRHWYVHRTPTGTIVARLLEPA